MRIGVRRNQRRVADGSDVPETLFIDVRHVRDNAQLIARSHQRFASVCQAWPGVGRMRKQVRHTFPEVVWPAPHWTERTESSGIEYLECIKTRIDRLGAFEMDDRGERSVCHCPLHLVESSHHAELIL